MGERKVNRYLTLLVLALGAVSIYLLPYLRWTYYDTLVEAVNLSNAQFAATMSIFGVTAMIFYAPGGYLADKLSLKKMLSFAFLSTGLLGPVVRHFPGVCGPNADLWFVGRHWHGILLVRYDESHPYLGK